MDSSSAKMVRRLEYLISGFIENQSGASILASLSGSNHEGIERLQYELSYQMWNQIHSDDFVLLQTCVMNANMDCEKCRLKVYEVVINVYGAYSIDIDAEQSMVKVSGKVNPKIILQVLGGKHAKVKSVKFDSEEPSMGGGYPPPPPPLLPPYGMGLGPHPYSYPNGGPYDYPMMMPPLLMLPPSPPPPPPSVAAQPQQKPTLLLEAPPQNSGATAQPQNSGTSAPPTTNVAEEAVIPSDKKSKRCGIVKNCSIM
ncbi:putative heavy metal-associated domain, HMA [Rosa chinensis]|uniref:Putative heavy metal-associated domain, HMA n=1 Tax=Rosa chinensis TaxID=74649 RepID=A0A2P6QG12_ROSCH|nr:putative heavy metal-associated domain, HMA [Rosa chinensis]